MEQNTLNELLSRLATLETKVKTNDLSDTTKFSNIEEVQKELIMNITELRSVVQSLDKDMAIQTEKASHVNYQISQLEDQVNGLKGHDSKETDRRRDLIEKVFMAILGGAVAYIFSMFQNR